MVKELWCYHGTSLENAEKIAKSKEYKHGTKRDDHWLGYGTYFFDEDLEQAKLWGRSRYKSKPTAALETVVSAKRNFILNLNTRQGIEKLKRYVSEFEKTGIEIKHDGEVPIGPKLANILFTSLSKEEVWIIIRSFPVPSKYDTQAGIQGLSFSHVGEVIDYSLLSPQVCVKNLNAIQSESIKIICKTQPMEEKKRRVRVKEGSMSYDLFNK